MRKSMGGFLVALAVVTGASFLQADPPQGESSTSESTLGAPPAPASDAPAAEPSADAEKHPNDAPPQPDQANPSDAKDNAEKTPAELVEFAKKGVAWLIAAQHNDGGWGSGSHAHQEIRDAHAVVTDPATTSFTLLALLRAGHTPIAGDYQSAVRRGLEYLVTAVEKAPANGPLITTLEGTQPQTKLGRYVDTAMTAQYLARALAMLPKDDALYTRVDKALDVCLVKLQVSQKGDGSWDNGGGWAPVLQSSLSCSALELAKAAGKPVDEKVLDKARSYQKANVDRKSGAAASGAAAGVELYAFSGGFRANAAEARDASEVLDRAKAEGKLDAAAPATADNLALALKATGRYSEEEVVSRSRVLAESVEQNQAQISRLNDEQLLAGFGSNGGEEYLSYLVTSETLLIAGEDKFQEWQAKISGRFQKVQNNDGSWSGHHCITSPVFCTAAVVQCLGVDRDREFLVSMAKRSVGAEQQVAKNANAPAAK